MHKGLGMKKGLGSPQPNGRPGRAVLESCNRLPPCGEGSLARCSDPSHYDPILAEEEMFASVKKKEARLCRCLFPVLAEIIKFQKLAGGPSQKSPEVMYHPHVPNPAKKEVRRSDFGVVSIVLVPQVLPILLGIGSA